MDDLISRQAAIDKLKSIIADKAYTSVTDEAKEKMARMFFADIPSSTQRWTPCSERLPTKKDSYLVTGRKSRDWYESDKIVTVAFYDGEFWTHNGDIQVEAWMPRPEPYKGEES